MENYKPHLIGNVIYEKIYSIETYPESENLSFDKVYNLLISNYPSLRICYATHDKDTKDDGTPVKTHTEILFKFQQYKNINVIAKDLDIPVSALNWRKDWIKSVRYLAHLDQPDKYQYDPNIVICSNPLDYKYLRMDKVSKEDSEISILFDFVDSHSILSVKDLQDFALANGLYATYRRNASILKDRKNNTFLSNN